jgi:hypothetical protein
MTPLHVQVRCNGFTTVENPRAVPLTLNPHVNPRTRWIARSSHRPQCGRRTIVLRRVLYGCFS